MPRKKYAIIGTGGRAVMFIKPIAVDFRDDNQLVAMADTNPARTAYYNERLEKEFNHPPVPTYHADDFDRMITETKPDTVIVTTVDAYHHKYIIRAMELGCDAITEKPMTTDDEKCRAILDTIHRTGKKLRVTFNYRWQPGATMVRKLLQEGTIGNVLHADMEYMLDTSHGADYFRRWHREKDKSGGLIVHKSTHHFDLVNWWLDAVPDTVFGFGRLAFYGRDNARQRGVDVKYDRYTGSDYANDPFAIDLTHSDHSRRLYLEAEKHDGYQRDRNVFGDNITAEDSMSVLVKYRTGTVLNYSLNAYLPREGMHIVFNGTKGRLEYFEHHNSHIIQGQTDEQLGEEMNWQSQCVVHPMFGKARKVEIPKAKGAHGGGDAILCEQIFSPNPPSDPYHRNAQHGQGAASILIGCAANRSFATGNPVRIADLCPTLNGATRLCDLP